MKVKEAKVIRHTWVRKWYTTGALKKANEMSAKEFCEVLRENGISYEVVTERFGDVKVEFIASFQEMSKLSEVLNISFENLRTYLH